MLMNMNSKVDIRQTDRLEDWTTGRQADRQTGRQADRQTDRLFRMGMNTINV
jgi:hypothetical protein